MKYFYKKSFLLQAFVWQIKSRPTFNFAPLHGKLLTKVLKEGTKL